MDEHSNTPEPTSSHSDGAITSTKPTRSARAVIGWSLSFQALWFLTIELASQQRSGHAALLNIIWTAALITLSRSDACRLLGWCLTGGAIGLIGDGVCLYLGLYHPAQPLLLSWSPAPLWLIALWCSFATLTPLSLSSILSRPWLAIMFGAIGGPLSYLAGVRLGAMNFGETPSVSLIATGVLWGVAMWVGSLRQRAASRVTVKER